MGCNCKDKENKVVTKGTTTNEKEPLFNRILMLITKTALFIFGSLIVGVIVIPFSIYMLFKVIYLNQGVDVTGSLKSIGKVLKKKDKDEEDDIEEYHFEDEDELVLLDSEEITR